MLFLTMIIVDIFWMKELGFLFKLVTIFHFVGTNCVPIFCINFMFLIVLHDN